MPLCLAVSANTANGDDVCSLYFPNGEAAKFRRERGRDVGVEGSPNFRWVMWGWFGRGRVLLTELGVGGDGVRIFGEGVEMGGFGVGVWEPDEDLNVVVVSEFWDGDR